MLVDVVYVLGGDLVVPTAAQRYEALGCDVPGSNGPGCDAQCCDALTTGDAETAERLAAAAALMGIARQIMHEIVATNGLPIEQARRLAADAARAAGWISGDGDGTEWSRAG